MSNGTSDNPLEHGVLCTLSTSIWSGRVKLPIGALNQEADPDWVRATKALVDRQTLKPIERIRNEARNWLSSRSLNFPIGGVTFVPRDFVPRVDGRFDELRQSFDVQVDAFLQQYDTFLSQAQERLGELFNAADYPPDVRVKFGFHWRFFQIGPASRSTLVSPELYSRETQRFHTLVEEFRDNAVTSLRERFCELVHHLTDRLTSQPDGSHKTFRNSLVHNFRDFLESFRTLNIGDDQELQRLVEQSGQLIEGVTPNALREDDYLRQNLASDFQRLQRHLDEQLVDAPRRRIRLPALSDDNSAA